MQQLKLLKLTIVLIAFICAGFVAGFVSAKPNSKDDPKQSLARLIDEGFAQQKKWQKLYETDKEAFHIQFQKWGESWFYQKRIVAKILGKKNYLAATPQMRDEFKDKVVSNLIRSYSANVLDANKDQLKIKEQTISKKGNSARVKLLIKTSTTDITTYFTFFKDKKANVWLIDNVFINGIDALETLQKSFERELQKNKGNLEVTIKNWGNEDSAKTAEKPVESKVKSVDTKADKSKKTD